MQAAPPPPPTAMQQQQQQPANPSSSAQDQDRQQGEDQPSLPPPPVTPGPLVRTLSGNPFRDNKPPPPLLAAANGLPQTPSGSGVGFDLNQVAAQVIQSAPATLGGGAYRVLHSAQGSPYARFADGRAMPLNVLHQQQQRLQASSSPTRATPGVFKQFKSPLVSPQTSKEAVIDQAAKEQELKEEEEREEHRRVIAEKKEEEERQVREALEEAEKEEEKATVQNQQPASDIALEHQRAPQQPRQQPPPSAGPQQQQHRQHRPAPAQRQQQQPPSQSGGRHSQHAQPDQRGRLIPAHPMGQTSQPQQLHMVRSQRPQQYQQQQARPYHPQEHGRIQGGQRPPYPQTAMGPARYSPYGPDEDVFIDRNGLPPAPLKRHRYEQEEDRQDAYEQQRDPKRPRSRDQSSPPARSHGEQDEREVASPEQPAGKVEQHPEQDGEEMEEEEETPFDPTAPIEPYDHVKEVQEPWNGMMDDMLPYIDEWAEKYLTTSLDTIIATYVCFYSKAKKDAQSLEEGFETIKSHQEWQNNRRQTFIDFRKQMASVAARLGDIDPEDDQALPTPPSSKSRGRK